MVDVGKLVSSTYDPRSMFYLYQQGRLHVYLELGARFQYFTVSPFYVQ